MWDGCVVRALGLPAGLLAGMSPVGRRFEVGQGYAVLKGPSFSSLIFV